MPEIIRGIIDGRFVESLCIIRLKLNFWHAFCVGLILQTRSTIAFANVWCSQLLIQFIVNNIEDFYLSFFFAFFVISRFTIIAYKYLRPVVWFQAIPNVQCFALQAFIIIFSSYVTFIHKGYCKKDI